ncbi:hypothetical protein Ahy_B02g060749 [Arachis hypogaea]|uniref:NADH-ubiquinone oxidoreductase chain 4 n=1 Tax=Arachis hypogaea TaxID=3818 RepID=A0A445AJB1_ARAHY|nr:hypothetical protein Ahy_B02g060749 [Arachis hypogaea]
MFEHFCECYSDLSGPILCPMLGSIIPILISNSRIRPTRLIDDLSFFFVILTTFLIPICILVGWSGMRNYGKEYITVSLIREFLMIVVFRILDPLLFYVLSESVLILMLCGVELTM